jgi:hypothetical protein
MMESISRGVLDPPQCAGDDGSGSFALSSVIARSAATRQSILSCCGTMDCFASLAMTVSHNNKIPEEIPMLTLHHLNDSRSQRILWLLEELGTPYEDEVLPA